MKYLVFFISTVLCVIHYAESATNDVHGNKDIRIIGGKNAAIESYPYQVAILGYLNETTYALLGSGALIRMDEVLTVAHLTVPFANKKMAVIAGETSIETFPMDSVIKVKEVIKHEKYSHGNITNDIAILKLESSFKKSAKINTVEVASAALKDNAECTAAGWGISNIIVPDYSKILRVMTVNKINNTYCQEKLSIAKLTLKPENFCTAGANNALCVGDEGAPLLCNKKIHGLGSSMSSNCGNPILPDVFVDVYQFKTWIKEHSGASFISVSMKLLAVGVFINIRYLYMK